MSKPLRILVTNDDGIHAPGLAVAEAIARALSDDVWVVAPESEVGSSRVDLQACKLEYSIVSPK